MNYTNTYLQHHGVKGMKWGVRRYQNEDGTLTAAGRKRQHKLETYREKKMNKSKRAELADRKQVGDARVRYNDLTQNKFRSKPYQEWYEKQVNSDASPNGDFNVFIYAMSSVLNSNNQKQLDKLTRDEQRKIEYGEMWAKEYAATYKKLKAMDITPETKKKDIRRVYRTKYTI